MSKWLEYEYETENGIKIKAKVLTGEMKFQRPVYTVKRLIVWRSSGWWIFKRQWSEVTYDIECDTGVAIRDLDLTTAQQMLCYIPRENVRWEIVDV